MSHKSGRPESDEFNPFYNGYISQVSGDDAIKELEKELSAALHFYAAIDEPTSQRAYEKGKWSIREVLGHVADTERVMSYRAMRIARGDQTALPGFDQDEFMRGSNFKDVHLSTLLKEFELLRRANLLMLRSLTPEAWERRGTASNSPVSVRALAFILCGHEKHHRKIVAERYLQHKAAAK